MNAVPRARTLFRVAAVLLAAMAALPAQAWGQAAATGNVDPLAIGRRIYREGILPSGQPLQGVGAAGVTLSGAQAACSTCHRRSGYGSSEGPIEVRPITGPSLFGKLPAPTQLASANAVAGPGDRSDLSPAEAARVTAAALRASRLATFAGTRPRPTYDVTTLGRSIREGVDVTGRRMNVSMPRFALEPEALASLTAYLKTLSEHTSPGVTEDTIHFATVIQPGASAEQRRALLEVLQTYVNDRNQGLRAEVRREETGVVRLRRSYREWVLHVWALNGPAETWGRQLEAYNARQPVFALVSGLGGEDWRPIHEFSERFEVPCILPQVDMPVLSDHDFYTIYLSRGMALEAQTLAKFLHDEGERGPVVQVFRRGSAGAAAAEAFRASWIAAGGIAPVDRVLDEAAGAAIWQRLAAQASAATMVLWLPTSDLAGAEALTADASQVKAIYLSSSLNTNPRSGLAADGTGRVRLVYPQDLPAVREARLEAARRWLRGKGIALTDERLQMNAYLAATVTGMAVSHSADTYSREFLLERMEHRLGTANELSIYPHLSLGPGQRYASKGSYIVQVGGADDGQLKPLSDWIVP